MSRRASSRRMNRDRGVGLALIGATVAGFAALFIGAAHIDEANGISVSESLANNGIHGGAAIARHFERGAEAPAVPARLIGECDGRILAAEHESAFPAGCAWIEPIRYESGE